MPSADVQGPGPGPAGVVQSVGRSNRVLDPRPALVHAVPGVRSQCAQPRCQNNLAVPRALGAGPGERELLALFDARLKAGGYVSGDVNGDGAEDFIIRLDGLHTLVQTDFVL